MTQAIIAAPLLVERIALRRARTPVLRTGMGADRSLRSRPALRDGPVLVAGLAGGLTAEVRVGHVVVASEIRGPDGPEVACDHTASLVERLRQAGLVVHHGPVVSSRSLTGKAGLVRLAATGALAVDMESWWLAPHAGAPFAVVRAISDGVEQPLVSPAIIGRGLTALRALRRTVPALDAWARETA